MTGRASEVVGRVCEAAGSDSKAPGWASQGAGRYYQKLAFENRIVQAMFERPTDYNPQSQLVLATAASRQNLW